MTQVYLQPLLSLTNAWEWKIALSSVLALLGEMFMTRLDFVALVALLVLADLMTGLVRAWRTREKIESGKLRRTVIKTIEYALFLAVAVGISNTFGVNGDLPIIAGILAYLAEISFCFVAITELRSIGENLAPANSGKVYLAVIAWMRKRLGDESDITVDEALALLERHNIDVEDAQDALDPDVVRDAPDHS
jgi:hypothetical protein